MSEDFALDAASARRTEMVRTALSQQRPHPIVEFVQLLVQLAALTRWPVVFQEEL